VLVVVTPEEMELFVSMVTVAWLLLATVVTDDVDVDDDAVEDADVFGVVLTANIFPWFVRMYTPFGVLITRTFSPAGILFGVDSVEVLVPGIMISDTHTSFLLASIPSKLVLVSCSLDFPSPLITCLGYWCQRLTRGLATIPKVTDSLLMVKTIHQVSRW